MKTTEDPREAAIGLSVFLTGTPGLGGRLRARPEDFFVDEIGLPLAPAQGPGKYTWARIESTNWETNRLVRELSRALHISREQIYFAGTKDKRAVTVQGFALRAPEARVRGLALSGVRVLETMRIDRAPKIGELVGNRFEIVVRGIPLPYVTATQGLEATRKALETYGGFPNVFGPQRFGTVRPITHVVGERIVRRDFRGAVMAYAGSPMPHETPELVEARQALEESGDFGAALLAFPEALNFERAILHHLREHPDDYTGAFRSLPGNLLRLFVYAYQSLLFNRVVALRLQRGLSLAEAEVGDLVAPRDPRGLPVLDRLVPVSEANRAKANREIQRGRAAVTACVFGSDAPYASGVPGEIEREVVAADRLAAADFEIGELPEASSHGTRREVLTPLFDFDARVEPDGPAQSLATFKFRLPKGSYATSLLREFLKAPLDAY
ncbi:MAG: tRNA pseudouridine(13) synthase TruD [Methanobacteriota archaeon]